MPSATEKNLLQGYQHLIEISRDLASTLDLDQLLQRIIHAAVDLTNAEAASILLYDPFAQQLHFQVATNMDGPTIRGLIVPLEGSIAGWILTNRQTVRIGDVNTDERYFGNIARQVGYETKSLIGVPLITKDKVVGVLEVLNKKEGFFTDIDEDLLIVMGAQAAIAIENTRLFQQSDLISEFVHELRTPLAAISTATYLLLRPEISKEQSQKIIRNVHSETLRLNSMTSSFLDLARLESGRVQFHKSHFKIRQLLEECVAFMQSKADENKILITLDAPKKLEVEADRDKLKQVILNLLSNSIKYNLPEGTITLSAAANENENVITVSDTGLGIPAKDLPHMFEKFYRVKDTESQVSGTGLGLSIVKQIVQNHGGTIDVASKPGEWTTFTICLPKIKL
jgi:signal transduction histidine kinase